MIIRNLCPFCGLENIVEMPDEAYKKWYSGMFIQDAWPDSTPAMRESVLTGFHEDCWEVVWGVNEDMEDIPDEMMDEMTDTLDPDTGTIIPSEYAKDKKAHIEGGFD